VPVSTHLHVLMDSDPLYSDEINVLAYCSKCHQNVCIPVFSLARPRLTTCWSDSVVSHCCRITILVSQVEETGWLVEAWFTTQVRLGRNISALVSKTHSYFH
jgi:hypothetical protein